MRITMFAFSLLAPSMALATPSLSLDGDCGDAGTFTVDGITGGGDYYVLWGSDIGSAAVPGGSCEGSASGLTGTRMLSTPRSADSGGSDAMSVTLSDGFCGKSVQFMDADTCEGSNVVSISDPPDLGVPDCDWATQIFDGDGCISSSTFYDEGYEAGYSYGWAFGLPAGLEDGESAYDDGADAGYAAGFVDGTASVSTDDAYASGYNDGHSTGFFEAYSEAYFEGHDAGYAVADDIMGAECDPPEDGAFWIHADYGTGTDFDLSVQYDGEASCHDTCSSFGPRTHATAARWACNLHGEPDGAGCTADTDGSFSEDSCSEMMVKRTYVAGDNARCGGDEVIPGFMDKHSTGSESEPNHAVECLCTDGPAHPLVGGSGRRGSYGSDLFHIDPEESAESVGTMDSTVTSLSYGEDGTLFYLTSGRGDWLPPRYFGIMDEDTGEQFEIGEVDFTGNGSLALSGGVMYQIDRTSSVLRVIDLATADTYDISSGTLYDHYGWNLFEYATCMTASPDGMLYVVSYADLWTVDPVTAEVTSLGMLSGSSSGRHIGCTFHDGVFYTNHNEELSIIDPVAMTIESTGVRLDMSIDALAGVN